MSSVNSVPIENKPLEEINAYADKVNGEKDAKSQRYEAAKGQMSIWQRAKTAAHTKYMTLKSNSKTTKSYELNHALADYNTTCNSYRDAEINEDISRDSYLGSIFYAGKINNQAIIANHASA